MRFEYPRDRGRAGRPPARHPRAPRPQRGRGDRRRAGDAALDRGRARVADRRGARRRLRARRGRRHAARAEHDLRLHARRLRVAHFGDFGQRALRDEQAAALGSVDLLFVPVGGGPTIGAAQAAEIAARLERPHGRADALPHRAHRLPRAGRRLRGGARRASSGWRPRASSVDALPPGDARSSSCPPRPEARAPPSTDSNRRSPIGKRAVAGTAAAIPSPNAHDQLGGARPAARPAVRRDLTTGAARRACGAPGAAAPGPAGTAPAARRRGPMRRPTAARAGARARAPE